VRRVAAVVRKLRGRDLTELRVRGGQALAAWRERTGHAAAELDVGAAALAARLAPACRASPPPCSPTRERCGRTAAGRASSRGSTIRRPPSPRCATAARATRRRCSRAPSAWRAAASTCSASRGSTTARPSTGSATPWPLAGRPTTALEPRPYLDAAAVGDHKVTWEVNRQQYLVTLGQAWHYTRDARWPALVAEHLAAWMDANPPKQGINWASSLEVAFRAMSWVWALHLVRDAQALTPALHARVLSYLHVHARHLEQFLSTYFSPNTHLTGEALGLVFVGGLVPELAAAGRWREAGLAVLREWLPRQVRPDGTYFEQATQYHRYTTEFVLQLVVLGRRNAWALGEVPALLPGLVDVLVALDRGDGTMPLLGDDDGGRLLPLDGRAPHELRGLLAQAAAVLGRPELAHGAGEERAAALWLLGPEAGRAGDAAPSAAPRRSRAFPDGGLWVLASGAGERTMHAVLDAGPHGALNAGHAHADALALVAAAGGRPLLVDAGTCRYSGAERNAFRGAAAHNVVLLDGVGASVPADDAFQWTRQAGARADLWVAHEAMSFVAADHDGFAPPVAPAGHRREVLHLPGVGWIVRDILTANGRHEAELRWHLAPGLAGQPDAADGWLVADGAGTARLRLVAPDAGAWHREAGWVSPRYGAREPAEVVVRRLTVEGRVSVLTFLLACPDGDPWRVAELGHDGPGRAFRLAPADPHDGATIDLIIAPGDGVVTTARRPEGVFASDAAWAWVRHGAFETPDVAGVIQGRHLHLGADTILAGASHDAAEDRWAVAARHGGAWHRVAGGSGAVPTSRRRGASTTTTSEDG
jgi:hypothetical protein